MLKRNGIERSIGPMRCLIVEEKKELIESLYR